LRDTWSALFKLKSLKAAIRKAAAALLATALVALLKTLLPLTLVPGDKPTHEAKCFLDKPRPQDVSSLYVNEFITAGDDSIIRLVKECGTVPF